MISIIKRLVIILAWMAAGWMQGAAADQLPYARDFSAEGKLAQAKQVPILVLFMAPDCSYCERVLREFLVPMRRNSAEYGGKVVMRQIDIGSHAKLTDFSGRETTQEAFALANKIRLTPTIRLFSPRGEPLGDPIVGLLTPDYYGGMLDGAIDTALAHIRNRQAATARPAGA